MNPTIIIFIRPEDRALLESNPSATAGEALAATLTRSTKNLFRKNKKG